MIKRVAIWLIVLFCFVIFAFGSKLQNVFVKNDLIDEFQVITPEVGTIQAAHGSNDITSVPISMTWERLNKSTDLTPVSVDEKQRMDIAPGLQTASWYQYGAIPGNTGNAILAGHRDWKGKIGVFQHLEEMSKDEQITITYQDGTSKKFIAVSKNVYPLNQIPATVMDLSGESRVTLITCTGKFDKKQGGYQKRVVVVLHPLEEHSNA